MWHALTILGSNRKENGYPLPYSNVTIIPQATPDGCCLTMAELPAQEVACGRIVPLRGPAPEDLQSILDTPRT
jgi:hypothetical protein